MFDKITEPCVSNYCRLSYKGTLVSVNGKRFLAGPYKSYHSCQVAK